VEGEKCWDPLDVRGGKEGQGGMGGLWRVDRDDGAEVDAWRFVGYGRGGIWKRNVPRWFDEGENVGLSGLGVNPGM
jgi:hypothetical protein